jgi:hypothetical protein|tara:strand:+ start:389 stop:691 length:303 start_codon:yes stop_codon:yes gene_type:complete
MLKLIQVINKNVEWEEVFQNMDRTITAKGEFWLCYGEYILSDKQLIKICDERIFEMMKLIPNCINFEKKYLVGALKYFKGVKDMAKINSESREGVKQRLF